MKCETNGILETDDKDFHMLKIRGKLLPLLVTLTLPSLALAQDRPISLPMPFWDIVNMLTQRLPLSEQEAATLPFLPNVRNCGRCTQPTMITRDGIEMDILAFNINNSIEKVNFNIRNDISNGCITLSYLKKKYNLGVKDGYMSTADRFDMNEIGYQKKVGKSILYFVAVKKTGERFSSPTLCTGEISVESAEAEK